MTTTPSQAMNLTPDAGRILGPLHGGRTLSMAASLAVRAALTRGLRSFSIALLGDSTGDNLDPAFAESQEWFSVLGGDIGRANPTWTVLHRRWNTSATQEIYDMPTVIQAGTGNGGGDRYADLVSGTLTTGTSFATSGDLDVLARVLPNDGWAPGGAAALRTIASRYSATSGSNRGWYLALNEAGKLVFVWSTNGTADAATLVSTVAVPFANGTPGWVRATHDVDNGAVGNDVKFYTSTDGLTWTQLGATVTTAAVAVVNGTFLTYYLGSINSTPTNKLNGRIYWIEIRSGLAGAGGQTLQVPPLPDWWDQATSPGAGVLWGGAPVIMMLNGSAFGQNVTYLNETSRKVRLNTFHGQALLFLSDGHNEGALTAYAWRAVLSPWLTDLRTRVFCPIVLCTQNPSIVGTSRVDQQTADWASARGVVSLALASTFAGVYPLDIWPQFVDQAASVLADGLHPTPAASVVWGNYVYTQMFS